MGIENWIKECPLRNPKFLVSPLRRCSGFGSPGPPQQSLLLSLNSGRARPERKKPRRQRHKEKGRLEAALRRKLGLHKAPLKDGLTIAPWRYVALQARKRPLGTTALGPGFLRSKQDRPVWQRQEISDDYEAQCPVDAARTGR